MEIYKNLSGNSGVISYEIGDDYIIVQFREGATYLYNYESAGAETVEQMKQHAISGEGLNSFINTGVGEQYAERLR